MGNGFFKTIWFGPLCGLSSKPSAALKLQFYKGCCGSFVIHHLGPAKAPPTPPHPHQNNPIDFLFLPGVTASPATGFCPSPTGLQPVCACQTLPPTCIYNRQ